jgi:uncharacterized membrane protein
VAVTTPTVPRSVRKAELVLSTVLRVGVLSSLALILAGTLVTFVHNPELVSSPDELARLTQPGASFPHTLRDVVTGLADLRGQAIVVLGLLLLIATPVTRVTVSILLFMEEDDRVYAAITTVVLMLLILSFVIGAAA